MVAKSRDEEEDDVPEHQHTFQLVPVPEYPGMYKARCACGVFLKDPSPATGEDE